MCTYLTVRYVQAQAYRGRSSLGKGSGVREQAGDGADRGPGPGVSGVSIPPVGTYELDAVHTVVGFVARHMLLKIRGQFTEFTGTIQVGDSPEDSRVEVEV